MSLYKYMQVIAGLRKWETVVGKADSIIVYLGISRAAERIGGAKGKYGSGAHNIDCVRKVWRYAPRKFYML